MLPIKFHTVSSPMIRDEKTLLKMLEYENIPEASIYSSICSVLNLQYFIENSDPPVHTLGSLSFVMDICGTDIKLIFVNEELTKYFKYIEFYLCYFLNKKDLVSFYRYLKMFVRMETGNEEFEGRSNGDVCRCVYDGSYCVNPSFSGVQTQKSDGFYNIFRHRFEYHLYTKSFLVPIVVGSSIEANKPLDVHHMPQVLDNAEIERLSLGHSTGKEMVRAANVLGETKNVEISLNLAEYFDMKMLNREVFRELPNFNFYWRGHVEQGEVVVQNSLAIHINGRLLGDASFLMKLGKTLEFSLKFFGYI